MGLAEAEDWPQFRGPHHDGISRETGWTQDWKGQSPRVTWQANVGIGFSGVTVSEGRVFTIGHDDGQDTIWCLAEDTGRVLWKKTYPSDIGAMFYIGGPGSTPTVDPEAGRVYVVGKWGEVFCLQVADGKSVWQRQLAKEESMPVPDWGLSGSPLRWGDLLVLNVGSAGLALDAATGATVWRSEEAECGYATPVPYTYQGEACAVVSSGEAYSGIDLKTGAIRWSVPWLTRYGVNAADAIVWRDQVFVSSGYGKGATLVRLNGQTEPESLWRQRRFRAQQNAPVRIGDHLYGFDGDSSSRAKLKCVSWDTGEVRWEAEEFGFGALSAADGFLLVMGGSGQLGLVRAKPEAFELVGTVPVLDSDCWTAPVLANGRILCRNSHGRIASLSVKAR